MPLRIDIVNDETLRRGPRESQIYSIPHDASVIRLVIVRPAGAQRWRRLPVEAVRGLVCYRNYPGPWIQPFMGFNTFGGDHFAKDYRRAAVSFVQRRLPDVGSSRRVLKVCVGAFYRHELLRTYVLLG